MMESTANGEGPGVGMAHCKEAPSDRRVIVLDESYFPAWDRFVLGRGGAMVQHTSAWMQVLERSFPHLRGRILAVADPVSGAIEAGLPVYEVRSQFLGNRVMSVPHATFCPPLVRSDSKEMGMLLSALIRMAREGSFRRIELRWRERDRLPGATSERPPAGETLFWHHYVDLNQAREELWRGLSRTAVRRKIRDAERAGIVVDCATKEEEVIVFHRLLSATRRRLGLPAMPLRFLQEIWGTLGSEHRRLWLARKGDQIVAGLLATMAGEMLGLDYYGEEEDVRDLGVNALLYWNALCEAQEMGMDRFSLGRTGMSGASDGLLEFKRRWGGVEEKLAYRELILGGRRAGTKVRATSGLSRKQMQYLLRRMPSVLHRCCSNLFYRHWA